MIPVIVVTVEQIRAWSLVLFASILLATLRLVSSKKKAGTGFLCSCIISARAVTFARLKC